MISKKILPRFTNVIALPKITVEAIVGVAIISFLIIGGGAVFFWQQNSQATQRNQMLQQEKTSLQKDLEAAQTQFSEIQIQLSQVQDELKQLKSQDQFKRNQALQTEIDAIQKTLKDAVAAYDSLLQLKNNSGIPLVVVPKDPKKPTVNLDALFTTVLTQLSQRNYASASASLTVLKQQIQQQQDLLATASGGIPKNLPTIQQPPASGLRTQIVVTDKGNFVVDVIAADLNSTRVQVETASPSDCGNNCPVGTLADYVARSHGYAGVNGPYFCPTEYPSCAGKTNSFDTLLMNKNKVYFNSANNVYSIVPLVVFSGNSAHFISHSEDWGRDTGPDAVIAGQPLLLLGGNIQFGGDGDPKKTSRTTRAFIANKDNIVYIGAVHGASVTEVAAVLKTMGLQNAINLDDGGSIALYANGHYIDGPGRQTPFGIVLVRK